MSRDERTFIVGRLHATDAGRTITATRYLDADEMRKPRAGVVAAQAKLAAPRP
jgi:hypothetical protein